MRQHLALGVFVYLVVVLVQIPAVVIGLHALTGFWWVFCVLVGALFGSVPILGSLVGVQGAVYGWGWSAGVSYSLFVGVPLFFLALGVLIGTAKMRSERRQPPTLSGMDPHGDMSR